MKRLAAIAAALVLFTGAGMPAASASGHLVDKRHKHKQASKGCTRTESGKCIRKGEFCGDGRRYGRDAKGRRLRCGSDGHWHRA